MDLDLQKNLTAETLSRPGARTSTVTGTGVNISAYTGILKVTQDVGAVSGTGPTLDGKIQDSADDSSYADLSGATFTQVTAADSLQSIAVDTRKARKFIRFVGTIGGTTPSFTMSATFVGQKQYK